MRSSLIWVCTVCSDLSVPIFKIITVSTLTSQLITGSSERRFKTLGWLVGCFGFNGPLRQYFSLYRAVSQREGERGERIDESKNVQTTPTRTCCKRNRPLPYCNQNCRTPRHWKFTQDHRTTRPPPFKTLAPVDWQERFQVVATDYTWPSDFEVKRLLPVSCQ